MKASQRAYSLIRSFEGLRLEAYADPVGIPTIGYGNTRYADGRPVALGDKITEQEAEAMLREDVEEFERAVSRLVYVPLTQNQFDALVSFAFNVGSENLKKSTLLRILNKKDYLGASNQFLRWVYAGKNKKKLPGLVRRRKAEKALFDEQTNAGGSPNGN